MSYSPKSLVHQALLRELKKEYDIDQKTADITQAKADIVTINRDLATAQTDISNLQSNSGSGLSSRVTTLENDKTTQDAAIALNTAKVGITSAQASAIVANTAKVGITTKQSAAITSNSAITQAANIARFRQVITNIKNVTADVSFRVKSGKVNQLDVNVALSNGTTLVGKITLT
ncbi:MAG: hypothetical protein Unbinned4311contig1001_31 [Prokaryotic dsDNA virus sp.]|nr:MAG: hypothetical protein Unbinned4311contig1001_31 [Prokaryotic dsDNA virus sp.]|tara:strand:+ start:1216 stop:1740 length:525 start_codon:yes stop_codon:yes gene_type:complete